MYEIPACADGSLRDLLNLPPGPADLGAVIDALPCDMNARYLPLDKTAPELCSDLSATGVDTVQDALTVLCERTGGGCPTLVSSSGHLRTLLQQFAQSPEQDLWLCVRAGDYDLGGGLQIDAKRSLRISGAGAASVSISLTSGESFMARSPALAVTADQVILEGLFFRFTTGKSHLLLNAEDVKIEGCSRLATATCSSASVCSTRAATAPGEILPAWSATTR